jgi:vancomycin resistance protein YoaR
MKGCIPAIFLVILTALLVGSVLAFEAYHAERIYPGVWVWGHDLSGLRLDEAAAALDAGLGLDAMQVTLRGPDRSWGIRPADLGVRLDSDATLAPAYALGREEASWVDNLPTRLQLLLQGRNLPPVAVYDEQIARRYLEALAEEIYIPPTDASLSLDGTTPVVNPGQPGRTLDVEATLAVLSPAVITLRPATVDLVVGEIPPPIADAEPARAEAQALLDGPVTLTLAQPREGDPGPWVIPPEQLVTMLVVQAQDGTLHAALNEDALRAYIEALAPSLAVEPVDATFNRTDAGQLEPISPSAEGRTLDVGASTVRVVQELAAGNRYISLVVQAVPPRYPDTATAEEIGVTDLVAEGESYFIGSPAGRDHNIRLAATKFHGVVVAPGETFSFNYYLGPVTKEEGYDESFITAGEELQMGIGGGICQVSTTAFRAAFWGGYPIVERWYHYQRVGYYELRGGGVGMDATVYSPHVDLKFLNDRPYPLLIQTEVGEDTHRLVFRFYSTDDGRRVEMEGPEVSDKTEPGPPIYSLDDEMAPGTVVQWQSAVGGLTATVVREVYDAEDALISRDVFVSKYAPRSAAYHYGPGYEPP